SSSIPIRNGVRSYRFVSSELAVPVTLETLIGTPLFTQLRQVVGVGCGLMNAEQAVISPKSTSAVSANWNEVWLRRPSCRTALSETVMDLGHGWAHTRKSPVATLAVC